MKQINIRWMAVAALAFGLGFVASVSALDSDPYCYSDCQTQMNECLLQVPEHQFKICARQYRECIAGCEQ
ncbi:MAG: hypothetical protein J0M09_04440 [Xanthomonadales bacterium]|jgi:hypothetical protein|nr:hypothetical protein [Xanthomonadales bacterium]